MGFEYEVRVRGLNMGSMSGVRMWGDGLGSVLPPLGTANLQPTAIPGSPPMSYWELPRPTPQRPPPPCVISVCRHPPRDTTPPPPPPKLKWFPAPRAALGTWGHAVRVPPPLDPTLRHRPQEASPTPPPRVTA